MAKGKRTYVGFYSEETGNQALKSFGERITKAFDGIKPYRIIYIALVAAGPYLKLELIWVLADIVNGLMAIPNLIALVGLRQIIIGETKDYFKALSFQKA